MNLFRVQPWIFKRIIYLHLLRSTVNVFESTVCKSPKRIISHHVSQEVSQSISQSVSQLVSQLLSQSLSQSVSPSVNQSVSQSVNYSVSQSINALLVPLCIDSVTHSFLTDLIWYDMIWRIKWWNFTVEIFIIMYRKN